MGSFASEYLALEKKRKEEEQKDKKTSNAKSKTAGSSFAQKYLALEAAREEKGALPGLSLPEMPAVSTKADVDAWTRRAQLLEESAARYPKAEGAVKGLTLPAMPTAPAGVQAEEAAAYQGPGWARQIVDRYNPENNQNIPMSPVAQYEAEKKKDAEKKESTGPSPTLADWGELAKQTALAGVGQMSRAAGATLSAAEQLATRPLGWLLGNPDFYKDGILYNINQNAVREADKVQQNLAQAAEKTGKAGELVARFGPAAIAALPQAALAYLTAGQSLAAQTSTAGLQAASTAAQLTGGTAVANTVLESVKSMAANPSFQYSFLNTVGGEYEQALADGADVKTAYAYAALSALANSAVEVGGEGGIDKLPEENKHLLLEWVKDMFDEGKEEVIQGAISQAMQNAVYGKGNPIFSMTDEDAIINPGRMAEDFAGGAVVGGILGGGQLALQSAVNGRAQKGNSEPGRLSLPMVEDLPGGAETGQEAPAIQGLSLPTIENTRKENGQKNTASVETDGTNTGVDTNARVNMEAEADWGTDRGGSFQDEVMRQLPDSRGGFTAEGRDIAKADCRLLENLGKITGSDIRVVSQAELDAATGQSGADGVQLGNRLLISEDAERPMPEVAKHELTHRLQDVAPAEYEAFRDYVAEIYRADGTLEQYIDGMIRNRENAGITLTEEQAMDEIAADYAGQLLVDEKAVRRLAGENRGLLEKLLDGLREFIEKVRSAFGGQDGQTAELEQAARLWQDALEAASQTAGDSVDTDAAPRFSIGYDQDNRPFVTVEEDILEGVPREDWVRTVKDNLRKKFPNGVTVGNNTVAINNQSRREMTFSRYMQQLVRSDPEIYADKLRATNNADEILRATTNWVNEALLHPRKDAIIDFARGEVQLRVGGNDYVAQVIVGNRGDGNLLLYDVIELEPANIQEKEAKTDYTTKPHTGTGSRQSESASKTSIHQPGQNVNPLRGLQLMDDRDYSQIGTGRAENTEQAGPRSFGEEIMRQLTREEDDTHTAQHDAPEELRLRAVDDSSDTGIKSGEIPGDSDTDRYSMKGDADLKKEVDRLRRQNQRLREQMRRTDRAEMNREAVQRQARELLKEYGSKYDKQTLYDRLETLYNGIANQTLSESDMRAEARSIAEDILSENREQTNGLYEEYQELRRDLRTRGISIAPEYRADLESAGGYEGLRKQYFGKLRLGNNGTAVDRVYDDLAGRYPELFPDDILHPADQLVRITEVLDSLQPVMGSAYEGGMDQAAEYLAGELLERYFDTPEKAPTFADKQARKMAEQRSKDRKQMLAAVAKERSKRETALRELRDQHQAANRKRIENQNVSQRRETIRRHADRLGRMLLRPTDKQHVPEALRGAALELVRQIDTGSNYFLDPDTGKRVYVRDGVQIDVESRGQIQTRRTQAARELQVQYEKLAAEGGYTVDPDMGSYLDEVANMGNKALGDMSKAELDTVWKVMRVIEHCITKSNDLLSRSRYATVSEMAEKLREQNGGKKDRRNLAGLAGTADQLLNMDMLTPETYFHKLGEAGEELFRQMRSAADQQTTILKEGVDRAQELVEKSGVDLRKAEKDMHTFTASGGELTLSTAQVMELYALSKREQALEHIYVGGLKPKGARTGRLGLVEAGGAAPVKVTASDVAEIVGTLTAEQKHLVDGLQKYLSGDLSRHGNDASMAVYGYEKFKEPNYWPIKVDKNQTKSDVKKEAESRTVAGYGMTKAVKPNARNAVVLRSVLDSYTEHLNQMATYSGWLATSEDVNRVHNFQFTDGDGNADGTVKTLLEQVYGKGGNSYWDKLMADVALGTKAGAESSVMDRGLNQFKAAKVGGNLRVILQQPTAIIRAANMIDPKYFLTAKNPMKGWETAKKYAPIAQWKDWGYFELDTGRSLKELIAGESGKLEIVKNGLMEPAGMADSVAWGHLWNAVEAETAEKRPELRRGSKDFYKAAAERFGEVIDRTQVVDSVLHRTQIMRSANSLTRMSTSFMSEPSKIYNMVYRDLYDVQSAGSAAKRAKAGEALARSAAALVVSFAVNAVAQSLPDMWRDKDRDKELAEKFTDAYVGNFLENFDLVGYVPFLKDFESIVQGYSVDRSDLEGFSDVVNALLQMKKAWDGESSKSSAAAALELACKAGDMLGLPMTNVKRDAAGIIQTALQGMGNVEVQYALDKLGLNPGKSSATFYDDLYRAMGTDWKQYESIYQDMISRGWDQEKLADNMEKRMAKEVGLEKTSSLPVEYSAPGENLTFDQEVMRQLTGGGTWMDTLPEGTLELAKDLEGLEPEDGADSVTKMQKIRELRDSIWGDEVKDLTLSNILGDADYERLQGARKAGISIEKWCEVYENIAKEKIKRTGKSGSPSQEDVTNALKGSGLTEKQKDAIWAGYGWKGERVK